MLFRNAVFLCLLALTTTTYAALTSAPIYAPCDVNYVRTDINVCTRSEVNPSFINFGLGTCISLTIPKSRKIKIRFMSQIESLNAVGQRTINFYGYRNVSCLGSNSINAFSITILEQVAVLSQVLFKTEKHAVLNSTNGSYSFDALSTDAGNKIVWYLVEEYTDR